MGIGYPLYRRRESADGGFTAEIVTTGRVPMVIDNKWVVPYCPFLTKTFNAHINVEFCSSVKCINTRTAKPVILTVFQI